MGEISSWHASSRHADSRPAWDEAARRLESTLRLVPYHPELPRLAAWPRLEEPDRQVVERTLARGLRMQASSTMSLVIEHRQLEALRRLRR